MNFQKYLLLAIVIFLLFGSSFFLWGIRGKNGKELLEIKMAERQEKMGIEKERKEVEDKQKEDDFDDWEKIDVSGWKVYRDEKYGFEFRYPSEWEVREEGSNSFGGEWMSIKITENPASIVQINRRFVSEKEDYLDWIRKEANPLVGVGIKMEVLGLDLIDSQAHAWRIRLSNELQSIPSKIISGEYLISNEKIIIALYFKEMNNKDSFSQYLPYFEAMVHSIKFF